MDIYEFLIPDEAITSAVSNACSFFGLPEVPIVNSEGVCLWSNDVHTTFDDVLGVNREQLSDMGMISTDSLKLAYTHECAHRALQNYDTYDGPQEELVCDYFAGIHAELNDIDSEQFEEAIGKTSGGKTHPNGALRVEAIEYGKQIASEMEKQGIEPTFEYCLDRFDDFQPTNSDFASNDPLLYNHDFIISFGSAYSKEEYIAKAENCYKEADKYYDKAQRDDKASDKAHDLEQAEKWRRRGDEYINKSKYADNK